MTDLLKELGDTYADLLAQQRDLLREIFERWDGQEVDTQGDSFFISFPRATQAVSAAVEIQQTIHEHAWPEDIDLRLRMGLHTGEPLTWAEGYVGIDVHRAARIAAVGQGGQVLLSQTTTPLIQESLPDGVTLVDLGRHRLKDLRTPERIGQLVIEGLPTEFFPLKSLEALPAEVPLELVTTRPPTFLTDGTETPSRAPFVARERELDWLDERLALALAGEGQIAFVTGGPGRGKSALLEAFARQAMAAHPNLLAVRGESSAHTGVGDPYQPFRGALGMLLGDLEGAWASGTLDRDNGLRLWEAMPRASQLLLETGPDLIDVFIPGRSLLARLQWAIEGGSSWLERLSSQVEEEQPSPSDLSQRNLFEQVEGLLIELSETHPLVLVLDDLQWADSASINLLFHLGRRLKRRRLMILGAYRPEEVAIGRGDKPHPLEKLITESKRLYGDINLDLGVEHEKNGQAFVNAFIDSEPNDLGEDFRHALAKHTEGHALFTVELLRVMQERGDLVQDDEGHWMEGDELDWNAMPARVEGVIEERIGRLEEALRETLSIASVEGEDFTAQVVARVQQVGERKLIKRLSRELDKKHRLVRAQDEARVGDHYLSHYRFTHLLFQRFLYNDLSAAERRTMHGEVARVLEELYAEAKDAITVQLATHYTKAGEVDKAIEYLQGAGDRARLLFAHEEAIQFYQKALAFQQEKGDDDQAARTLMKLGLTYHSSFDFESAGVAWEEGLSLWGQASLRESTSPLPSAPHALRMQASEPITLDPNKIKDGNSASFIRQIFSGLVEASPDNSVIPDIAQSWEVQEGGTRYLFYLREDARWSDGTPVTSGDFEYSWKRALAFGHSNVPDYFYDIKDARAFHEGDLSDPDLVGVRSLDERTLQVELEQPASYFLHLLTNSVTFPIPRHVVERYEEAWTEVGNIVTNGPFRLESWQREESMVLTRNEDYSGRFTGNLKRVEIQFGPGSDFGRVEAYEADELDVIYVGAFLGEKDGLLSRFYGEIVTSPFKNTECLCIDTTRSPFNDSRVRKAIAMATNRVGGWKAIERMEGHNTLPATGGFVPPSIPGHSPGISTVFNPQEAKRLLADAGYPEGKDFPIIDVIYLDLAEGLNSRIERTFSSQWKEILGIESKWEFLEWRSFPKRLQTNRPMMSFYNWGADYPDPDNFLRLGLPKWTGWQHDAFDTLIEKSRRSMDQNERLTLLREADKILMEEALIIPLLYIGGVYLVKPWVRRYFPAWKYIIIEPH